VTQRLRRDSSTSSSVITIWVRFDTLASPDIDRTFVIVAQECKTSQMAGESRAAMVEAAASLFRRQGYDATSWRQITAASEAPAGSIGFLFPGGKEQLATEVVSAVSATTRQQIGALLSGDRNPDVAIRRWIEASARILERSGFTDGCPIATLALEMAHRSPTVQQAIAGGYAGWIDVLADHLRSTHGDAAEDTAEIVLSAFEGALLLSRARRSIEPLEALARNAEQILEALL
jgi:TetR/AcrR family transcriptional regulator, lmrAB and yxaGH operons repressor